MADALHNTEHHFSHCATSVAHSVRHLLSCHAGRTNRVAVRSA